MTRTDRIGTILLPALLLAGSTILAPAAFAQHPPWPNGCSVLLPFYVQQGLDAIFLGACDDHDRCWGQCNDGPEPPYLGLAHRQQCDLDFLADMETACILEAAGIVFPIGGFDDAGDFIENCTGVAATFYAAVANPAVTHIYWASQCIHGCNFDGCGKVNIDPPPTCGMVLGPGGCYIVYEPPPPPPPNLCDLIDCAEFCGTAIGLICCPGCSGAPNPCLMPPGSGEETMSRDKGAMSPELATGMDIWNCGC